jgi:hypothetical protein
VCAAGAMKRQQQSRGRGRAGRRGLAAVRDGGGGAGEAGEGEALDASGGVSLERRRIEWDDED